MLCWPDRHTRSRPTSICSPDTPSKTPEEKEQDAIKEKAYKDSLKKIPDAKAADPWGTVRSETPAKAAAKTAPAKPKTKTGSSVN